MKKNDPIGMGWALFIVGAIWVWNFIKYMAAFAVDQDTILKQTYFRFDGMELMIVTVLFVILIWMWRQSKYLEEKFTTIESRLANPEPEQEVDSGKDWVCPKCGETIPLTNKNYDRLFCTKCGATREKRLRT